MFFFKLISHLFHPLLFSFLGSFLYLILTPKHILKKQEYVILIIIFISTYILPIFVLTLLKRMNMIQSYKLETIDERKFPILFFIILSFMIGNLLIDFQIVDLLAFSFYGTAISLCFTYILFSAKIKTSLHMIGIGGILSFIIIMSFQYKLNFNLIIAILFILAGIIAVSRLALKAHRPKEIYIGFLVGMISQLISYQFYHSI